MPTPRRKPDRPIQPEPGAGADGRNGATTSAHQEPGLRMMNGRLGKKKAKSIKPTLRVRLRKLCCGVSFHRRSRRKGAITIAICLTATARPRVTQLALG